MGIYSDGLSYASTGAPIFTDTLDSIREDSSVEVYENYDLMEEGYVAIGVMNENYNRLMSTIGIQELVALESTGEELVYTEGVLGSLVNGIKNFLKKIWERIKSLFKHFMMIIDGYMKNDKDFCNKYRKQIYAYHDLSDFTFKGYKWTIDTGKINDALELCQYTHVKDMHFKDGGQHLKDAMSTLSTGPNENSTEDAYKKALEYFDDSFETYRGTILEKLPHCKAGTYTMEEFRKELKQSFRNGEDTKEELDDKDLDPGEMFTELFTSKQTKKTASDNFKTSRRIVDTDIKTIDSLQKTHVNNAPYGKNESQETISAGQATEDNLGIKGMDVDKAITQVNKYTYDNNGTATNLSISTSLTSLTDIVSAVNRLNKDIIKKPGKANKTIGENKSKLLTLASKAMTASKECLIAINTATLDALKERSRQFKACLTKIVYHKGKSESAYTESAYDREPSAYGTDFISSIEFK